MSCVVILKSCSNKASELMVCEELRAIFEKVRVGRG